MPLRRSRLLARATPARPARGLVVLESVRRPTAVSNPYVLQTVQSLPAPDTVHFFTFPRALFGRYDVFHVHWPETLLRGRTPARSLVRLLLGAAVMTRLALTGTPVVRVLHNETPHERGAVWEGWALRLLERRTTTRIDIAGVPSTPRAAGTATVLHGHYRDWYQPHPVPPSLPGRLLFFGLIRPYKGVPGLLEAFRQWPDPTVTLRVVGAPLTPGVGAQVAALGHGDPRVSLRLCWVPDDDLAGEIGQAELVVLPYREMGNSGAALLALSLGRPVLVPRTDHTRALADEVGTGWVRTYEGPLTAGDLRSALAGLRAARAGTAPLMADEPDLSRREWGRLGEQLHDVLAAAVGRERPPGRQHADRPAAVTSPR